MLVSVIIGALYFYPIRCRELRKLEPRIVDGEHSRFTDFSYSALLGAYCLDVFWNCGASILNQHILITAAHCLEECNPETDRLLIKCGDGDRDKGKEYSIMSYVCHPDFNREKSLGWQNDIALLRINKPLRFSKTVGRVALMSSPPLDEVATVAGWGMILENSPSGSKWLRHVTQIVSRREKCEKMIGKLPPGVICGGTLTSEGYPAPGDSGSALVVKDIIQIGIVSFKRQDTSKSVVVYTDVAYFYNWITKNAEILFCNA